MISPTAVLALTASAAVIAVLTSMVVLLLRSGVPLGHHELNAVPDGYRPRPWDQVTGTAPLGEAYISVPLPDFDVQADDTEPEQVAPVSAPPAAVEPIDELDPIWDWKTYADAAERELAAA